MKNLKQRFEVAEIMILKQVADYLQTTLLILYHRLEDHQRLTFKIRGSWRFRKNQIKTITLGASIPKEDKK